MTVAEYICRLCEPSEHVATVMIPHRASGGYEGEQRVWPTNSPISDKVQAWLHDVNARRYDVFVGMKSIRPLMRPQPVPQRHQLASRSAAPYADGAPAALSQPRLDVVLAPSLL